MQVFEDVACSLCGCICDDLRVSVDGERIASAEGACALARPWFLERHLHRPPVAAIEGKPASLEAALDRAVQLLGASRAALIYGLTRSSTEGQRAAIALAEQLGGTVDTTSSLGSGATSLALQTVGESTCTLGESRCRSDLVIFWGCDPVTSHPRHGERYSIDPPGVFLPEGRAERFVVVIDSRRTASAELADLFIPTEPGREFHVISALRALALGKRHAKVGVPAETLATLFERMRSCRSGVVFFGEGLSSGLLGPLNVTALLSLVAEMHRFARFYARGMNAGRNATGADNVLCWQTGYPFAVNFGRGYPRWNPGEFSANGILARGETDAVVLVGSETVAKFSPAAQDRLRKVPTICLDHAGISPPFVPTVQFTTAVYGIHRPGTATRMDEVSLPVRTLVRADWPSDDEVLAAIARRL